MLIADVEQGTKEWFDLRIGNPGASSFDRIITSKGEKSKSSEGYMDELFDEIIYQQKTETYQSSRMKEGIENEDNSVISYEIVTRYKTDKVGLCYRDEKKLYHCSPDRLVIAKKGGFESKDAIAHVQRKYHQYYNKNKRIKPSHWIQCQGSLLVTQYNWWDFQSYCETPNDIIPQLLVRIYPDDKFLVKLEAELNDFCTELWDRISEVKNETI